MEGSRPCAGPQNERGKLLLEFMENFNMPVDIFIFSVYFPSTNYPIDEYKECFSLLWALFETYCDSGPIIILGNLSGSWE